MTKALDHNAPPVEGSDEIGLKDLVYALRHRRWMVLSLIAVCVLGATGIAALVPKKYEATVLLSPVTNPSGSNNSSGLGSTSSQLGGLASLVGISALGSGGFKAESIATLQSRALTERFIERNNLLPILFSKDWDPGKAQWTVTDPEHKPTLWKGSQYLLKNVLTVTENTRTGLVSLSIVWTNPESSAQWANGLVRMTNDYLREKALTESEQNIAYLNEQVAKTNVVEIRTAIFSLMESEIKQQMLARGTNEYALRIVDPAVVPETYSSPKRSIWAITGLFLGVVLSLLLLFLRASAKTTSL